MIELGSKLKPKTYVDFTSLVDIIFILLIFFILSYNETGMRGHKIHPPEDITGKTLQFQKEGAIVITAYQDDRIFLQNEEIKIENLRFRLLELIRNRKKAPDIFINAEAKVEIQTLVSLMDAIKLAGITKAPFLHTQKKREQ